MPNKITPPPLKRQFKRTKKRATSRAKLALVPSRKNQFRPYLVRSSNLVLLALFVLSIQIVYNFATSGTVLGTKVALTPASLLEETNHRRAKLDLPPLSDSSKLDKAAEMKASDMFANQYWAHTSPAGVTPWQWFGEAGYKYSYAGENLAKNFNSSDGVMAAWMASPKHRDNIVDEHYTEAGFAIVNGELDGRPTTLIVALYGAPGTAVSVAGATDSAPLSDIGLLTRVKMSIVSLTPAAIVASFLILIAMNVALLAHSKRKRLPKAYKSTWHKHQHGIIKTGGMAVLLILILAFYSGGSI